MHDFLTVGAPAPLQQAAAFALDLPDAYFAELAAHYQARRDRVVAMLERAGLRCSVPSGAYYVMTDITGLGWTDDVAFVRHLVEDIGVAAVPGIELLPARRDARRRAARTGAVLLLQEGRDAGGSGAPPDPAHARCCAARGQLSSR